MRRVLNTSHPVLEPGEPPYDDTAERDNEEIDRLLANGHHLRRLRGASFNVEIRHDSQTSNA